MICKNCEEVFEKTGNNQRFCSKECTTAFHNANHYQNNKGYIALRNKARKAYDKMYAGDGDVADVDEFKRLAKLLNSYQGE